MEKMWMICNINGTCKMCNCRGMIQKWFAWNTTEVTTTKMHEDGPRISGEFETGVPRKERHFLGRANILLPYNNFFTFP